MSEVLTSHVGWYGEPKIFSHNIDSKTFCSTFITLSKQGQIGSFQLIQEHQHLPKSQLSSQLKQIKSFSVFAGAFLSKGHQAPKTPTLHHNPVMEGNVLFSHFMEMIKLILLDPNENDL